jgi:hypothetical protein
MTTHSRPLILPDFIIGGSPRSGTTWTHKLLSVHPDVFMAQPEAPEPKFFHVDDLYDQGLGYYARTWFQGAEGRRAVGEKTSYYLENPTAARRIHADLPGVKLIFLLRDPAARAYSNYLRSRHFGFETESFEAALELEEERERTLPAGLRFIRPHAYASRGMYADHLQVYIDLFGMERILCLAFEDIARDPGGVAACVHRFIGVEERPQDGASLGRVNEAPKVAGETRPAQAVFDALRARFRAPNRRLAEMLGRDFGWD